MTSLVDRAHVMAAAIFAAVVLIMILLARDFKDPLPELPRFEPAAAMAVIGPTNKSLPELFAAASFSEAVRITNGSLPFATTFFEPPPPPPPKKTRKVNLTYNGYFEAVNGEKRAYVLVGDKLDLFPPGAAVVGDVVISNILRTELTLQQATQAVVVPFRGSKEVEVPLE